MSIPEEIGRMLPEEIKNIPNQVFYPRLSELAGKRKSGKITREELEEYYLLKGNVVDREVSNSIGEAEAVKRSKEDWEERGRFLDVLDEFLELSPHSNKFNEMDKVALTVDVADAPAGAEGFVSEVIAPPFIRYQKDGKLVFVYELVVHQFDPETLPLFGREITYAYEDELERITEYTVDRLRSVRDTAVSDPGGEP